MRGGRRVGLARSENGRWLEEDTITLYPYDSGTDCATTYQAQDLDCPERQPITRADQPISPENIFYVRIPFDFACLASTGRGEALIAHISLFPCCGTHACQRDPCFSCLCRIQPR